MIPRCCVNVLTGRRAFRVPPLLRHFLTARPRCFPCRRFVGHIGAAELGAVALGTMWVNISGLSIVFGGMGALDTLCSQACKFTSNLQLLVISKDLLRD